MGRKKATIAPAHGYRYPDATPQLAQESFIGTER